MSGNVFEEDPCEVRSKFPDDPFNVGPEMPLVLFPAPLSGLTERLAGVSGDEGVDSTGEGAGVEGGDVVPDRGGPEVSGVLRGDEAAPWVFLPFDKTPGVESGLGEHEAHIKASAARAEG